MLGRPEPLPATVAFDGLRVALGLARVRVPVLVIHGDRDGYVPVEQSRSIMRTAFAQTDAQFVLLPRTAHGLWMGERDSTREVVRSPGFSPAYWRALLDWLRAQELVE